MRLLLTSNGLANQSIWDALTDLLDKPAPATKMAFIPTASNVEPSDKGWLIDDLYRSKQFGFREIDIVDISALPPDEYEPRLRSADVIAVGGGSTPHLLEWLNRSGISNDCSLFESRLYVGISAGSIAAGRRPIPELSDDVYTADTPGCLGLAGLVLLPHLNSPLFPRIREATIRSAAAGLHDVYALDDESALKITDGTIEVVSEGQYLHLP